jgi:hypothetical protein
MSKESELELFKILELARWAPSAENVQVWRFKIINDHQFEIYIDRELSILGSGGEYGILHGLGCLLETIEIAASHYQFDVTWQYLKPANAAHQLNVTLHKSQEKTLDPLFDFIQTRSVNRMAYANELISNSLQSELLEILNSPYSCIFQSSKQQKNKFATQVLHSSMLRYCSTDFIQGIEETLEGSEFYSYDKMPLQSLGLSNFENAFFKWGVKHPRFMKIMNQFLGGSFFTALRLDVVPILSAPGVFYLVDSNSDENPQTIIQQGKMIQRFWLSISKLGLVLQPYYIMPVLCHYQNYLKTARRAKKITSLTANQPFFFCGRIGYPKSSAQPTSRSLRLPLQELIMHK